MDQAVCRDLPTELFFPGEADPKGTERAKAICGQCPVRRDCARYALADPDLKGIWGATTERQRTERRRQLRRAG